MGNLVLLSTVLRPEAVLEFLKIKAGSHVFYLFDLFVWFVFGLFVYLVCLFACLFDFCLFVCLFVCLMFVCLLPGSGSGWNTCAGVSPSPIVQRRNTRALAGWVS